MAQEKKETIFPKGIYLEKKDIETIPWLKASLSIKVDELVAFLQEYKNDSGYVNLNLKESKMGLKWYLELDTFVPKQKSELKDTPNAEVAEEALNEEIPF